MLPNYKELFRKYTQGKKYQHYICEQNKSLRQSNTPNNYLVIKQTVPKLDSSSNVL